MDAVKNRRVRDATKGAGKPQTRNLHVEDTLSWHENEGYEYGTVNCVNRVRQGIYTRVTERLLTKKWC